METTIINVEDANKKESNVRSQEMFENEKMWKLIIKMAVPTIMMFLAMALYTTIDTLLATTFIGQSDVYSYMTGFESSSDAALAIAGWTAPLIGVILGIVIVFNTGAEIRYSSQLSKGEYKDARETLGSTVVNSLIFSVVLGIMVIILADPLIDSIAGSATDQAAKDEAVKYLRSQAFYVPFVAFFDLVVRAFRVEGKMGSATVVGVIGMPLNLLLDFIFMGVFDTGISGAALASIIGYGTSATLSLGLIMKFRNTGETNMLYNWKSLKPKKIILLTTLAIGFPFVFRTITMNINNISFLSQINSLGTVENGQVEYWNTTAGAYSQTYMIVWMTVLGLVQGTSSVLAYNYGAKKYDRAKDASLWTFIYMIIISAFFVAIFVGITPQIMQLFSVSTIDSVNTEFIRITLIRNMLLGISFVPFVYLLNTKQVSQSYWYSIVQCAIFAIVLTLFSNSNLASSDDYYKILPWVVSIADMSFLILALPYYFYKMRHIERDHEIQQVSQNSKQQIRDVESKYSKETKEKLNAYRMITAKEAFSWKVEKQLSNWASIWTYRTMTLSSKGEIKSSPFYRENISKSWKEYVSTRKTNIIKTKEEKQDLKFSIDKGYYDVYRKYKVEKKFGILRVYDKENSIEFNNEKTTMITKIKNTKDSFIDSLNEIIVEAKKPRSEKVELRKQDRSKAKKMAELELTASLDKFHSQRYKDIEDMRNEAIEKVNARYNFFKQAYTYEIKNSKSADNVKKVENKLLKRTENKDLKIKKINKKYDNKKESFTKYIVKKQR